MQPLSQLWSALEDVWGQAAPLIEWRNRLGAELVAAGPLLRPTDRIADSFSTDHHSGRFNKVVLHGDLDIVGVPSDGGPVTKLSKTDVLTYRLNYKLLTKWISRALELHPDAQQVTDEAGWNRLGTYRPYAGFEYPVYLILANSPEEFQDHVERIPLRCPETWIILAPTDRKLTSRSREFLERHNGYFIPLAEVIVPGSEGIWTETPQAQRYFARFRAAVMPEEAIKAAPVFQISANTHWSDIRIKFVDGETVSIVAGDVSGRYTYQEMGLADGRNKKPNKQWQLLQSIANNWGTLTAKSGHADRKNQKRCEVLNKSLRDFFRLDSVAIEYDPMLGGWRTLFTLEPESLG